MGSAARHRERPEEPPPDASAVIAELGRIGGETDAIIGRMKRTDGGPQLIVESISLAAHWAEAREQLEALTARLPSLAEMHRMGVAEGRRQAEREAAEAERAAPVRHRHRKPRLSVVGGTAVTLAAASVAGGAYVAQDSALAHHWSAASPAAVRLHEGPADSAVPVPSWSPSAKPSAAVASAHPAPVVTASPTPSSTPPPAPAPSWSPPPPPAPPPPDLIVPSALSLDGNRGTLTLTAGDQAVEWTLDASPGLSVDVRSGVLAAGQSVQVEVYDGPGVAGWLYASFGGTTIPVKVTSSLGAPAVAMP